MLHDVLTALLGALAHTHLHKLIVQVGPGLSHLSGTAAAPLQPTSAIPLLQC